MNLKRIIRERDLYTRNLYAFTLEKLWKKEIRVWKQLWNDTNDSSKNISFANYSIQNRYKFVHIESNYSIIVKTKKIIRFFNFSRISRSRTIHTGQKTQKFNIPALVIFRSINIRIETKNQRRQLHMKCTSRTNSHNPIQLVGRKHPSQTTWTHLALNLPLQTITFNYTHLRSARIKLSKMATLFANITTVESNT